MKMNKGRAVWTEEAEYHFRHVWPNLPCKRVAGEEAYYAGEKIDKKDLKRPESVAHEWMVLGWIKWVDSGASVVDTKESTKPPKQWKPWMPGYEDYLRDRWETLQYWFSRADIQSLAEVSRRMGFSQSAALSYFVKKHGQELAEKYGRLPRVKWKTTKPLSELWTRLMEDE
jgi:hypothetical protein